jgi:delta14-sterol reductase
VVALLGVVLPGPSIAGAALEDKSRLTYKCNGLASLVVLIAGLGFGIRTGHIPPTVVAENGGQLCSTTLAFCLVMSVFVYLKGYLSHSKTASLRSHVTGNILHDWWFGVQLNPDFLGLDLKFFWIRTGMLGWFLINLSVAAKQFQNQGSLSLSMALYQAFSAIYVLDYFWHEEAMTSTYVLSYSLDCAEYLAPNVLHRPYS